MGNSLTNIELKALLKKVIELCMPDFRNYYRIVRKGKVIKSYASDGAYHADIQILRNDESADENEPIIPKVEIPVVWGGQGRGVICPPATGTMCDVEYYDGDPNYPRISNFRGKNQAPTCGLNEFIIQLETGTSIKIDSEKNIISLTPSNYEVSTGVNWTIQAGDSASIIAGNSATIEAGTDAKITAPMINLETETGTIAGVVTGACVCQFTGNPHSDCSVTVKADK
jgi:hypothetical protein